MVKIGIQSLYYRKKKLSYKDNYFDLAFCTSVLHHVEEYKKTINELVRVSSKYIFIDYQEYT